MKNALLGIRGGIEGLLGVFIIVCAIGGFFTQPHNFVYESAAAIFGEIVMFLLFIFIGFYLVRDAIRIERRLRKRPDKA